MSKETAFVTGATGLLGNNLVRRLVREGFAVRALVRSRAKASRQFADLPVEIAEGDISRPQAFADALQNVTVVFHTAAHFRDSYKGGSHWEELRRINVEGTASLLNQAYKAGVRRFVHASSTAVVNGTPGQTIDETMLREEKDADDYYRSKILSDREVLRFLETHPDFFAVLVLPGWMHGPGDAGPTSAGQMTLDFMGGKLPGIPPGSFSVVDARDVAEAMLQALYKGSRGERYLTAGTTYTMGELSAMLEKITGIKGPTRPVPMFLLLTLGALSELWARITGKPVLLSWATVQTMRKEAGRTSFSSEKSEKQLGIQFRPVKETLADVVDWYRANGFVPASKQPSKLQPSGHSAG